MDWRKSVLHFVKQCRWGEGKLQSRVVRNGWKRVNKSLLMKFCECHFEESHIFSSIGDMVGLESNLDL